MYLKFKHETIQNARGYVDRFQDSDFNKDLFEDITTWKIVKGK